MDVPFLPEGIYLPALDLWLDPEGDRPVAFLSHGHADHARGMHGQVLCSQATSEIYALRGGATSERRVLAWGETIEFRGARLTLYPAGHILGAAQLLVEFDGERLVYTGDLKLNPPLCADSAVVVPCDHLIIESTFGLPMFRFLPASEAGQRIVRTAQECLAQGVTPVFLGYALGRGQELVLALSEAGVPVAAHGAVAKFLDIYRRHTGKALEAEPYEREQIAGKAVVGPPGFGRMLGRGTKRTRIVAVSGWALLDSARARYGAEVLIPYSDHASFDELLRYVTKAKPKRVDVVHGYASAFASILRQRGIDARAPDEAAQQTDRDEVAL